MESECYTDKTKEVGLFFLLLNLVIVFVTSIYKVIINFTLSSFVAGYVLQPFLKIESVRQWSNYLYEKGSKYFSILYEKIPLEYKKQYVKEDDLKHTTNISSTNSSDSSLNSSSNESSNESELEMKDMSHDMSQESYTS